MSWLVDLAQQVVNGLSLGSVYALIAVGLTLVFGIARVGNFAHGDFVMVSAYALLVVAGISGMPLPVIIVLPIVVGGLLALLAERVVFRKLYDAPPEMGFVAAIGMSLILQSLVLTLIGATPRNLTVEIAALRLEVGGIVLTAARGTALLGSLLALALLAAFLHRSRWGRAVRAVAQHQDAAQMVGVPIRAVRSIAMALSGLFAGWAAILIVPILGATPTMGVVLVLKAFAVVTAGGLGSVGGAVVGAYLLGLAEALVSGYLSADYRDAIAFALLVAVLLVRPHGLFGDNSVEMELRR